MYLILALFVIAWFSVFNCLYKLIKMSNYQYLYHSRKVQRRFKLSIILIFLSAISYGVVGLNEAKSKAVKASSVKAVDVKGFVIAPNGGYAFYGANGKLYTFDPKNKYSELVQNDAPAPTKYTYINIVKPELKVPFGKEFEPTDEDVVEVLDSKAGIPYGKIDKLI